MSRRFWIIVSCIVITIVALTLIVFRHYLSPASTSPSGVVANVASSSTTTGCLSGDESASYSINTPLTSTDTIKITIEDKANNANSSFIINDLFPSYHPIELYSCNFYVMREFNYDYVHGKVLPNFNIQVWKYDYSGNSQEIGTAEDFRVNSSQTMMAAVSFLTTSTMPSLEVYDLSNDNIVFSLSLSQIPEQESNTIVNFDLENGGWSHDGRYLWFDSNDEADTLGFLRIDTSNWSYQVFSAPHTTMGGDALNPDVGMTTYETNVAPWTADSQIDQEYRDQAQQAGQITSFYIYNLLTGQNYLVTTTTDPTYYYHPLWLSDSELQYTLPSGATSTYTIP